MQSKKAYSILAKYYEYLTICDYEQWSQYLYKQMSENNAGKCGIDVGCGSGYFTRSLKKYGYDITGADISEEMLSVARQTAAGKGMNILFTKQDAKSLKTLKAVDFVTAINDLINYLDSNGVDKAFKNINKCLKKGGLFLFDISSEYKLKNIIGNNMFAEDDDSISYIWFNHLEENCVIMDLSIFVKAGELYAKREETHVEYIHSKNFIEQMLIKNNFRLVKAEAFLGGDIEEKTERIFFVCQKI
jgi:ubiquinone/menaquinone biosynthesis C-methylase UbiE